VSPALRLDVEDPSSRDSLRGDTFVWLAWSAVALVAVAYHEPWRDELQAWSIARESTWPWEVVERTAYEGHPPLWHLLLWAPAQISRSPATAQLCAVACAGAAVWLIVRWLPFTLPVRALVVFGYLPLYEMATIARSYSLLFLLAVAALVVETRRPEWIWVTTLAIGAMMLTFVLAIPLAVGLAAAAAWRHRDEPRRRLLLPAGALLAAALLSVRLARPPDGGGRRIAPSVGEADEARDVLAGPLRIVVPVFDHVGSFWGSFVTDHLDRWGAWLGVAVLLLVAHLVRRSIAGLLVWSVGSVGYLGATLALSLPMEPRHLTALWLTLLAAVWLAGADAVEERLADRSPARGAGSASLARVMGAGVLLVGVYGAVWPVVTDLRHPFSGSDAAAEWITGNGLPTTAVYCATTVDTCSAVAIRLDVPAYSRADADPFTYVVWRRGWKRTIPLDETPADAARLARRLGGPVTVVALYPYLPAGCATGWVSPPAIVESERVAVCSSDDLMPTGGDRP
jgi:hypothetical protein